MAGVKFLAFDHGAGSGRAILGHLADGKLSLKEIHRFTNKPVQVLGHVHWDVLRLFDEMKTGMKIAAQQTNGEISGIGVDTWGVDFGLVARDNVLLGNPYAYRDSRTNGMMEQAFEMMPKEQLYNLTGIQFMQFNSIFQLLSMVKTNNPILDLSERLLFMPDLFNFLMTGEKVSEYTIASTSQLLNAQTKHWEPEIFVALSLPIDIMPPIVEPGTIIGKLLSEITREVGLPAIDVIAPACHDTGSAVAAIPAQGTDWAYLSSGTWSLMGIEREKPIINDQSLQNNFTNEGGVGNKIRFLRNIMGLWLLQECRRIWAGRNREYSYAELIEMAMQAKPFKCIVNPDDARFLLPADMTEAICDYCKETQQTPPETVGEFVRTILESLALKYKYVVNKINSMTERPIEKLHIVGGGSQNELLNQFAANATGLPVVAGPVEATAIGNILIQAIAKKEINNLDEARQIVASSFPLKEYLPDDSDQWDEVYNKFEKYFS